MRETLLTFVLISTLLRLDAQNRYDVVIDEIMADPSPSIGLPAYEWMELKNTGATPLNLQSWRVGDASGQSGPLPAFILQPDSFVVICSNSALASMTVFGRAIAVSNFPSLDNDGDQLFLRAANGKTIHALSYSSGWYRNELKKEGGWTLEMIDTRSPCGGMNNWKACNDPRGGTPGIKNSIDAVNPDLFAPKLKRAYSRDSVTIILMYDEPLDSLSGGTLANYVAEGGISLVGALTLPPLFDQVQLKVGSPMSINTIYGIIASNIKDCQGNPIGTDNKVRVGVPADALQGDWIINEILFNPRAGAYDFVEFHNKSNKILDASDLSIANRNSNGQVSSIRALSPVPFLVFPGDYIVTTEDADNLSLQYLVKNPGYVLPLSSLPSFPDDEGDVIALNFQGTVVDEVKYRDDWHFKLLDDKEGVSLERIDPAGPSQDPFNWHSAASTAGFGTPGYKNSQYKLLNVVRAGIEASPKIFSPDNDGRDDIATIQYEVSEPGYVAVINIFDAAGRPVRNLVSRGILGLKGSWNWDGLDDRGMKLPLGAYIILTELFNLRGKKDMFKNIIVLARNIK